MEAYLNFRQVEVQKHPWLLRVVLCLDRDVKLRTSSLSVLGLTEQHVIMKKLLKNGDQKW